MPRAVTAAIAGLICAGCGGGDDSGSTAPAPDPPPRGAYVAALDAVCREESELRGHAGGLGSAKRYIRQLKRANVERRALLARYQEIVPSPEHRRFHRRYVDAIGDQVALTDRLIDALEREDGRAYERLTRRLGAVLLRRGDLVARQDADFEHCGRP